MSDLSDGRWWGNILITAGLVIGAFTVFMIYTYPPSSYGPELVLSGQQNILTGQSNILAGQQRLTEMIHQMILHHCRCPCTPLEDDEDNGDS